jgi:hypothetical protein
MLRSHDVAPTWSALDCLANVELVEPGPAGRYRVHDLVRLVAAELADAEQDGAERERLPIRAVAYYAGGANRAVAALTSGRLLRPLPPLAADVRVPDFQGAEEAGRWMTAEIRNVLAAVEQAGRVGGEAGRMVVWCADALWFYCYVRFDRTTIDKLLGLWSAMVKREADPELSAWVSLVTGRRQVDSGRNSDALRSFNDALVAYRDIGHWEGVAKVHLALGIVNQQAGEFTRAIRHFNDCRHVGRQHGLKGGEALALFNIGSTETIRGRLDQALAATTDASSCREAEGDLTESPARSEIWPSSTPAGATWTRRWRARWTLWQGHVR